MADEHRMALSELLRKAQMEEDADFLQEGVRVLAQALMEPELSQKIGAERYERTPKRTNQRHGYRDRPWDTRVGTTQLKVPAGREEAGGAGTGGGGAGSLRPGGLDAAGGRSGAGSGYERDEQEPGISVVPGAGRGGGAVSEQEAGR